MDSDLPTGMIDNAFGYDKNATKWYVKPGHPFEIGDRLHLPRTGEKVMVTDVLGTALDVVRGDRGTRPAAVIDLDPVYVYEKANDDLRGRATRRLNEAAAEIDVANKMMEAAAELEKGAAELRALAGDDELPAPTPIRSAPETEISTDEDELRYLIEVIPEGDLGPRPEAVRVLNKLMHALAVECGPGGRFTTGDKAS